MFRLRLISGRSIDGELGNIFSSKMMNELIIIILFIVTLIITNSCEGQQKNQTANVSRENCSRAVYGGAQYIKLLPPYICIPEGFIIDDFVRISDLNGDEETDFLAVKYNKKHDDQIDGDLTYWDFYHSSDTEEHYSLKATLSNLVPPYIKNISYQYLAAHPAAAKLFETYPRRLSHQLSFLIDADTIRLSYKFDDSYGKSFVFVSRQDNWYLENVEYFLGELPMYWCRETDFYYPLNDKLKMIESRKPMTRVAINEFDLSTAFKHREDERSHLSEWHIDTLDETQFESIMEAEFKPCNGMDLPDDWKY